MIFHINYDLIVIRQKWSLEDFHRINQKSIWFLIVIIGIFTSLNNYETQYKIVDKLRKNREICLHYEPSILMIFKIRLVQLQRWWYLKKGLDKLI